MYLSKNFPSQVTEGCFQLCSLKSVLESHMFLFCLAWADWVDASGTSELFSEETGSCLAYSPAFQMYLSKNFPSKVTEGCFQLCSRYLAVVPASICSKTLSIGSL